MTALWLNCSLQRKCDSLEVKNSQYTDKFTQSAVDRQDILSYLQMLLMQKGLFGINQATSSRMA